MTSTAPIGKVVLLAKKHPVITVAALGIVAVLVAIRARSSSSISGFDETGTGADSGGGGGGGGSVPLDTVPGAPSSLPASPTQPSVVLSSPIMSIPQVPAIPGYSNPDYQPPTYAPVFTQTGADAFPMYTPPPYAPSTPSVSPLRELAQKSENMVKPSAPTQTIQSVSPLRESAQKSPSIVKPVALPKTVGSISGAVAGAGRGTVSKPAPVVQYHSGVAVPSSTINHPILTTVKKAVVPALKAKIT